MAFISNYPSKMDSQRAGTINNSSYNITLSASNGEWEDVIGGRFVQLKGGKVMPLDAEATPLIAGVALRVEARPIEDGELIKKDTFDAINYCRVGIVAVAVKSGETAPSMFTKVQVINDAGADAGLVVASSGVEVNAEFLRDLGNDVWLVLLK